MLEPHSKLLPLVWLLGKVQSGKSSIIRVLTRRSAVEVGTGYKPCTRASFVFDFPSEDPIIRFLDTRGLGERDYDAREDIAVASASSHLIIVAARAMDLQQAAVISVLTELRRQFRNWPILVALTNLHEGYDAEQRHVLPYPFGSDKLPVSVPADLKRCLEHQRMQFSKIPGNGALAFVPIDFTQSGDGYDPVDYGADALIDAILVLAPTVLGAAIAGLPPLPHGHDAAPSDFLVLRHAAIAAASDVVPIVGLFAVSVVQARMLQQIALAMGVSWDKGTGAEFAAALGSSVAMRGLLGTGARQLSRLVPGYGQTVAIAASSASSFAVTYALGVAARSFLAQRRRGKISADTIAQTYRDALREALLFKTKPKSARAVGDGNQDSND